MSRQTFRVAVAFGTVGDTVVVSSKQWNAVLTLLAQLVETVPGDDTVKDEMRQRLAGAGVTVTPMEVEP